MCFCFPLCTLALQMLTAPIAPGTNQGKWKSTADGVATQIPVSASELSLRSALLRTGETPSSADFHIALTGLHSVSPDSISLHVTDRKGMGYFLNQSSLSCGSVNTCVISGSSPARPAALTPADLWLYAKGKSIGGAGDIILPICQCSVEGVNIQKTLELTFFPVRSINYTYQVADARGKVLQTQDRSGWPARAPLVISVPLSPNEALYKIIIHHTAAGDATVEDIADAFTFLVP